MPDGTTRFSLAKDGTELYHFMGCSCFAQYTVVADISLCKINPKAPMDRVCVLGCGISTGYGAAINTAQVKEGSTVGVWGLGAVGLAAIMGAKKCGAKLIIGIDKEETKFDLGESTLIIYGICTKYIQNSFGSVADLLFGIFRAEGAFLQPVLGLFHIWIGFLRSSSLFSLKFVHKPKQRGMKFIFSMA